MGDSLGPRDRMRLGENDGPAVWEALGRAIKVERTARGWERRELAERAGVSYPYLSEIETGKKRPSWGALASIAEALGLRSSDLLGVAETRQVRADGTEAHPEWLTGKPMMARSSTRGENPKERARLLRELLRYLEQLPVEDLQQLASMARALAPHESD